MKDLRSRAVAAAGLLATSLAAAFAISAPAGAAPAGAAPAGPVTADCHVFLRGKNLDGVGIICAVVSGGQARGRADCVAAPDRYTNWVRSWDTSYSGWCLFSARGAILEVRAG